MMRLNRHGVPVALLGISLLGCAGSAAPQPQHQPAAQSSSAALAQPPPPAAVTPEHVCPCKLQMQVVKPCPHAPEAPGTCNVFPTVEAALAEVLQAGPNKTPPQILAIGETHALAEHAALKSTTSRVASEILPKLAAYKSLIVEALIPAAGCDAAQAQVREQTQEVTAPQSATNQSDLVKLAARAKELGITPFPLRLTCDEMKAIAAANEDAVSSSLRWIAQKTIEKARALQAQGQAPLVLYGGALHNDVQPLPGRESFSFGPALSSATSNSVKPSGASLGAAQYIELDVISREFVAHRTPWNELPWYSTYVKNCAASGALLLKQSEQSYVLILPWQTGEPSELCRNTL
jgi:hypothetical protein